MLYVSGIGEQLQAIASQSEGWQQMKWVDTIVIPIQVGGTWLLYLTERSTRNQMVLRLATGYQREKDPATMQGVDQLDTLIHNIGRGALDIWLRMVLRDITSQESVSQREREDLRGEINSDHF